MSMLAKMAATAAYAPRLYVDDVFSAHTYTGNGGLQPISNGIDLGTRGGLVWIKSRTISQNNTLCDTTRGTALLSSNLTSGNGSAGAVHQYNTDGFTVDSTGYTNTAGQLYVSWAFRKATKFFDVVSFTHTSGELTFKHALGVTPGMVIIKKTDGSDNWWVYHSSLGGSIYLTLNQATGQQSTSEIWRATAGDFTVGNGVLMPGSHVAYLFAHDVAADGLIQCGSYTANGNFGRVNLNLGWEPQFLLTKRVDSTEDWHIADIMRGVTGGAIDSGDSTPALSPNLANAENPGTGNVRVSATGVDIQRNDNASYIYLAIRRPNKPPTRGTQVFQPVLQTGTGTNPRTLSGVSFAPDTMILSDRLTTGAKNIFYDRLRGSKVSLASYTISNETGLFGGADGVTLTSTGVNIASTATALNGNSVLFLHLFFKRAPGFMDVVCYTGNGIDGRMVAHNLKAVPELILVKSRSSNMDWLVSFYQSNEYYLKLNDSNYDYPNSAFWPRALNSTKAAFFSCSTANVASSNANGVAFVAYLFASLPGVSKIGRYTGNGSSQTISCGFSNGARLVLIKRANVASGDWYVWDSVRGIVPGYDPHLSINTTAVEIASDDSIDPDTSGFVVNQLAPTNINVSGTNYIFLAIA